MLRLSSSWLWLTVVLFFSLAYADFRHISGAEYYIDDDPGAGQGTAVPGSYGDSTAIVSLPDLFTDGLSLGMHAVYLRFQHTDSVGNSMWGEPRAIPFNIATTSVTSLSAAEYFLDSDPGPGNAVPISASYGSQQVSLDVSGIAAGNTLGTHSVFVRCRNIDGTWGEPRATHYNIATTAVESLIAAEYFVDSDPGQGNGIPMTGSFGGQSTQAVLTGLSTSALQFGTHALFVRFRDSHGIWGNPRSTALNLAWNGELPVLAGAEYFIGNDPGQGSGSPLYSSDGAFGESSESVYAYGASTANASVGLQLVHVRMQDSHGLWGRTTSTVLDVQPNQQLPFHGLIYGTALDMSQTALGGVTIQLSPGQYRDTTDAQGNFSLANIPPGQYVVTASKDGYVTTSELVSVAAGSVTNLTMTLSAQIEIALTVLDERGQPVQGANVSANGQTPTDATTNSIGLCTLRVAEGNYQLDLSAAGFMDRTTNPISFTGSRAQARTENMSRFQTVTPTFIVLIRGISKTPEADNNNGWDRFIDSLEVRFPPGGSVSYEALVIKTTGSLYTNATRLRTLIDNRVGNQSRRIVLIGHSMGGLIARKYLSVYQDRRVERIITIDTPHLGSNYAANLDRVYNKSYYDLPVPIRWFFPRLFPAYYELGPDAMREQNKNMLLSERPLSTKYILLSTQHGSTGERGDWIVNLASQKADPPGEGTLFSLPNMSSAFDNRVKRPPTLNCSNLDYCSCAIWSVHVCVQNSPTVIQHVLGLLNTPFESIAEGSSRDYESEPAESVIAQEVLSPPYDSLVAVSMTVPQAAYVTFSAVGVDSTSVWSAESPTGTLYFDELSAEAAGGTWAVDPESKSALLIIPNPIPGEWTLRLGASPLDTTTIVVSASAPLPVQTNPIPLASAIEVGDSALLAIHIIPVDGVFIDSIVVTLSGDSTQLRLNDSALYGDALAEDSIWSAFTQPFTTFGNVTAEFRVYSSASEAQYESISQTEFTVLQAFAAIDTSAVWHVEDSDSNTMFEALVATVPVLLDSACALRLTGSLFDLDGNEISTALAEGDLTPGSHSIALRFPGEVIENSGVDGPYVLSTTELTLVSDATETVLQVLDSISVSPNFSASDFVGIPTTVQNVGAFRTDITASVFWTPNGDPDIASFKLYYDTDGAEPYLGNDIMEGASPIAVGNTLSFDLHGLDSLLAYTFAVSAVDSEGSESRMSQKYTVFPMGPPFPVDSLTIVVDGNDYVLHWQPIPGGAQYIVEVSNDVNGPWSSVAQTIDSTYRHTFEGIPEARFFRIVATR